MIYLSLLSGISLFLIILFLHILLWRKIKPRSEMRWLLLIFIILPLLLLLFFYLIDYLNIYSTQKYFNIWLLSILYLSLAGAYIQTYPALTCEIPTFKLLRLINASGNQGISLAEIKEQFHNVELIDSRINLLVNDGLIKNIDGKTILTWSGNILAKIFLTYRNICGL